MTSIPAAADVWHLSKPAPKNFAYACPSAWLPLQPGGSYREKRLPLMCNWPTLTENWLTLEEVLQGSTSYGSKKATLELTGLIPMCAGRYAPSIVSSPLQGIDELVESSRKILELEQDWDGEGASTIAESTWRRAIDFLRGSESSLWNKYGLRVESPSIVPASDGSIDLHWKLSNRELLINIPPSANEQATYYGDNRQGRNSVEGKLDTNGSNPWLFVWLSE